VVLVPLLLWAFHRASGRVAAVAVLRVGLLVGICTVGVGWEAVWKRFADADPMSARRELAVSSMAMVKAHPWFGTGLGTWPTVYPQYAIIDFGVIANQAHDDWLQWTVEGGIPFAILLATLFVWSLRPAFRTVWGVGVVAVFLHAIVDYQFSRPALGSWAIVVLALLAFADRERADRKSGGRVHHGQATEARGRSHD
jgi:O-antigen ligase